MDKLFLTVLNMSLTGTFVIAAVCLARLPLKKAPKIISYCLWAVAGFRLVFPFSIESVFSLIPFKASPIPADIAMQPVPRIDSGIGLINNAVSGILPAAGPAASVNPLQIWTAIGAAVWLAGFAAMLIYGAASFLLLKRKMRGAAHAEANILEAEDIKSPFVLGMLSPRIYLPAALPEREREYILLHEQTHIRRRDHIVKCAAYSVLCLHWFNPLAWIAFLLMGADMEMSCDERVMKELGGGICGDYSLSLVRIATGRRNLSGSPLAFGEGGMKERVKRVLNFKRPSRIVIAAAVALAAVLSAGFAVNRIDNAAPLSEPPGITVWSGNQNIEWAVGKNEWNGSVFDRLDNFQRLMTDKTIDALPYIKNGGAITIAFGGAFPDAITVTEYILSENGGRKYNVPGMSYNVRFGAWNRIFSRIMNRPGSFTIRPRANYATGLSSNSADYMPGNTIKGYSILCAWGGNECEYGFVIRGDAAITMINEKEPPSDAAGQNPDIINASPAPFSLDKAYLGMTAAEVYALFGEPDFQASGLMWFGYDDVGVFDPGFSAAGVIERISFSGGKSWSVIDLVSAAVIQHYADDTSAGAYPAERHQIVSLDASESGFTAEGISQYELYLPDGEYDVRRVKWAYSNFNMTFAKNENYDYVLSSYSIDDGVWPMGMAPVPKCYDDAMYHFVGAIPSMGRFSIGVDTIATAVVNNYALSETGDYEGFLIKYFPGATLQIEPFNEENAVMGYKPGSWIIEYADSGKNITVGRNGTGEIPITDDLIGIYNAKDGKYGITFEKFKKQR
ncbi:MAG: M56 family metallopeptidase [Oscillospiraceae bacterium]|jgi:beta-lactamase regulating signal transducer with metallopeptidase domain|nr:M56 family metallopeptidase [Oscillospiraceae bacterium]